MNNKEKIQKSEKSSKKRKVINTSRVRRLSSIRAKVCMVLLFSIALTILLGLGTTIPSIKNNTVSITENYMRDLTDSYGKILNQNLTVSPMNLNAERLAGTFSGAGLEGMESSYFYILNSEGNILYHPNSEMLGQTLDIAPISTLIKEIKESEPGFPPEPGSMYYNYEGADKRATYYVTEKYNVQTNQKYLLPLTV